MKQTLSTRALLACGLVAGLLSALFWFHLAAERPDPPGETAA